MNPMRWEEHLIAIIVSIVPINLNYKKGQVDWKVKQSCYKSKVK